MRNVTLLIVIVVVMMGAAPPVFEELRVKPIEQLKALPPLAGTANREAWEKRRIELRREWHGIIGECRRSTCR